MEIVEIDQSLLATLQGKAEANERLRMNYDLRTSQDDTSQRMLNALRPGTIVPIHRHLDTSETTICLHGKMDVVFYAVLPESGGAMERCTVAMENGQETELYEVRRVRLVPAEGQYGVQIPAGAWHSVAVYEPSTIFEAKDGAYRPMR